MRWINIEDIAEALEEKHPDEDLMSLRFTSLYNWIIELPEFDDDRARSNEKVLEAIQAEWISLREENL